MKRMIDENLPKTTLEKGPRNEFTSPISPISIQRNMIDSDVYYMPENCENSNSTSLISRVCFQLKAILQTFSNLSRTNINKFTTSGGSGESKKNKWRVYLFVFLLVFSAVAYLLFVEARLSQLKTTLRLIESKQKSLERQFRLQNQRKEPRYPKSRYSITQPAEMYIYLKRLGQSEGRLEDDARMYDGTGPNQGLIFPSSPSPTSRHIDDDVPSMASNNKLHLWAKSTDSVDAYYSLSSDNDDVDVEDELKPIESSGESYIHDDDEHPLVLATKSDTKMLNRSKRYLENSIERKSDDGEERVTKQRTRIKENRKRGNGGNYGKLRLPDTKKRIPKKMVQLPFIHLEANSNDSRSKVPESDSQVSFKFWRVAPWVTKELIRGIFHLDGSSGHVSVEEGGAYLIYVQVLYHDAIGRWSLGIVVNEQIRSKCLESEQLREVKDYHPTSHGVYKQCSITTIIYLSPKQNVAIRCMYGQRTILTQAEFSFWGMVKLA